MSKRLLPEITYIRGLCMLGVIAIHVASLALGSPVYNLQVVGFMELATRFSIPVFFFLSAFGLFYHQSAYSEFSYKDFLKRRLKVVMIPYFTWSIFYMIHSAIIGQTFAGFLPRYFFPTLFFGTACYQLYFITIIFWFYLLMPLWRYLTRLILKKPVLIMSILFLIQTAFNYYSSYHLSEVVLDSYVLQYALSMRLNYWVLHYFWIWLFGAVVAERYDAFLIWIHEHELPVVTAFLVGMSALFASFYYIIYNWGYTPTEAIFTVHQLSPVGMIYTAVSVPFLIYAFHKTNWRPEWQIFWNEMGKDSFGMYLVHPFILSIFAPFIPKLNWDYNTFVVFGLYIVIVLFSLKFTMIVNDAPKNIRRYLIGR